MKKIRWNKMIFLDEDLEDVEEELLETEEKREGAKLAGDAKLRGLGKARLWRFSIEEG